MGKIILHVDMNSYFATVEQQANPRLRGKPIGVTGGDRMERTVLGTASVEAKRLGIKTGTPIWKAKQLCPELILVKGDSDKYLECTKRFINILKNYSPYLEIFSIDESFLELKDSSFDTAVEVAEDIKSQIKRRLGEWVTCSVGISYSRIMAKLGSGLYKPNGLVVIKDPTTAQFILDRVPLDEVCGIGSRINKRLFNMGIRDFPSLRKVPLGALTASFKSYGLTLYNLSRGIDTSLVNPFYEKEEIKSVGHRHTLSFNTNDPEKIRQVFLKLTELIARRLRAKKLVGKTVSCWYRYADFSGDGQQTTIIATDDGLNIYKAAWGIFLNGWNQSSIRMVGVSISNLKPKNPSNLTFLEDVQRQERITKSIDTINDKYGEFILKRAVLIKVQPMSRKPNPYLSDRRFKI